MQASATSAQWRKVLAFLDQGRRDGTVLVDGGPTGEGLTLRPAVVTDLSPQSPLWREEVFGPVLAVSLFLCAFAWDWRVLAGAQLIAGLASGVIIPATYALTGDITPPDRRSP